MKDTRKDYLGNFIDEDGVCNDDLFDYVMSSLPQQPMPTVSRGHEEGDIELYDTDTKSAMEDLLDDNLVSIHYYYDARYEYGDNGFDIYHDFGYTLRSVKFVVEYLTIDGDKIELSESQCKEIESYLDDNYIDESESYNGSDEYDPNDDIYDIMKDWN